MLAVFLLLELLMMMWDVPIQSVFEMCSHLMLFVIDQSSHVCWDGSMFQHRGLWTAPVLPLINNAVQLCTVMETPHAHSICAGKRRYYS